MKTALCYSGQIGAFRKAIHNQKKSFLDECDDIYAYTSDVVSHKGVFMPTLPPSSQVFEYLRGGVTWRKHLPSYGSVYKVDNLTVEKELFLLKDKIKKYHIQYEDIYDTLSDHQLSKWNWLRKRQLWKMHACNELIEDDYDIVIRSRFEFSPFVNIPIKEIYEKEGADNKVFVFGGWKCVAPMIFMDPFFCDGFAFGSPKAMNVFTSLYLQEDPYPYDPQYKECWEKYGDNVEYQLKKHLEKNGIELVYIGNKRSMYHLER